MEDLGINDILCAASRVEVKSIARHLSMDRKMVWLGTHSFKIPLTRDHQVVVLRGGLQRQPIQALCKHWNATMRTGPTLATCHCESVTGPTLELTDTNPKG